MKKEYILILFICYIIIILYQGKKYYNFYPTLKVYPNNFNDSLIVEKMNKKIPDNYKNIFYLTDESVSNLFVKYVNMSKTELNKIIISKNKYILGLKYLFNRARPDQINKNIKKLKSYTADTPAYPSGHAFQAYFLAKYLSKKYKHNEKLYWEIAEKCAISRVYAGLHYLSDNEFSKYLVLNYF